MKPVTFFNGYTLLLIAYATPLHSLNKYKKKINNQLHTKSRLIFHVSTTYKVNEKWKKIHTQL